MKVQNKVIIVTGGGGGLGRELVLGLLAKEASVIAVDISQKALDETFKLAGDNSKRLFIRVVDLTDKNAIERVYMDVIAQHGFVDGLINNAGIIQPFVKLNELGFDVIDRVFNVNFLGTLYMTKAFLPYFLSRPEAHIVNIASMGGFLPVPGQTIYCASKAAVKLMTEGLNAELTDTKVHVSIVFPGAMNTNIMVNSGLAGAKESSTEANSVKILSPVVAAERIIKGMEQNKSRMLIGTDSKLMDFLYRINPKFASRLIYKQMKAKLSI